MINKDQQKAIAVWTPHIDKKQSTGVSRAEYCRNNKLVNHQMAYWENRLRSQISEKKLPINKQPITNDFVKAVIVDETQASPIIDPISIPTAEIIVCLDYGIKIELNHNVNPGWVADFVEAIRRRQK